MSQLNLNTNYIDFDNGQNRIIVNGPAEISNDGKYEIVKFTGDGTFQITKAARPIEFLLVGGGGPGGANNKYYPGGAGGGGGQLVSGSFNSVANYQYQVKVGPGGTTTPLNINLFQATGGLESTYVSGGVTYKVHTFTSGTQTLTVNTGYTKAEMLIVGAGGGGATGGNLGVGGEGGGAGAVVYSSSYDIQVATGSAGTYTIKVGAGGAADQAGQTSSFTPNFSYAGGYQITAFGGGAGSGSGASGGGDGTALYGTSSFSGSLFVSGYGQDGGQRLIYSGSGLGAATMSYYAAPGGGGMGEAGKRNEPRLAQNWRVRLGEAINTVYPTYYNITWVQAEGGGPNYNFGPFNVPNCANLGVIPGSGSVLYLNQTASFSDLIIGFSENRKLNAQQFYVDFLDQQDTWINYMSATGSNSTNTQFTSYSCGDFTLNYKNFVNPNSDGGGNGGRGIPFNLQNGTASYYGAGGGGGVYEGFGQYWSTYSGSNTSITASFSGSYGGVGGGGNGAGALLSLASGSLTGSLFGLTGSANTGGGGGGGFASDTVGSRTAGGAGGSGVVIIRYPISGSENQFNATGSNGGDSSLTGYNLTASFFSFAALGGGAGGGEVSSSFNPTPLTGINGQNGGSGGGAGWGKSADGSTVLTGSFGITLAAFGNNGAAAVAGTLSSGGGGGAGGAASLTTGGIGKLTYISGSGALMGAGGAAYGGVGQAGSGSYGSGGSGNGGQGADGVVIVRFSTSAADNLY
jgi:hypothetical protein